MTRWSMSPISKLPALLWLVSGVLLVSTAPAWAERFERDPMTMRVIAVNPSADKSRTVPVRIDLPQEVKPSDVLDHGELAVDYDTERSLYYVHKPEVTLAPKQTKVFEVLVRDVWYVPEADLTGLKSHTALLLHRLQKSEYYEAAKKLGDSIQSRLDDVIKMQEDETIGRRQRIGAYRRNLQGLQVIKEDIARMEKLLSFAGGPPVPQMLQESPLKSDAPSTTTTWLVIFLIIIFMGLLAGQFFFTWHRRASGALEGGGELGNSQRPGAPTPMPTPEQPSR